MATGFFLDGSMIPRTEKRTIDERAELRHPSTSSTGVLEFRGRRRPIIWYGLTLGASFKGIEASVLVQGAMQRDEYVDNQYMDAGFSAQNNGYSQAYQQSLNRWIP